MHSIETEKKAESILQPEKLAVDERVLTEVDHLLAARYAPNLFDEQVKADVLQNLTTGVQEAAMPYAITTTHHEVIYDQKMRRRTFRWLGQTAVQTAMSGYSYHHHPSALRRVDVEVEEARHASETLRPGRVQVFISPRMSRADATLEDARREHLGDDDAVRISWIDDTGEEPQRVMQSLLVRDVPLSAWVAMLADPENIFGKSIAVEDAVSALSVMKVHRELELDQEQLPNGPVTLLEKVVGYIDDEPTKQKVLDQVGKYYGDQELMRRQAEFKAARWLEFECELAESLASGQATSGIKAFIATMQHTWNQQELRLLANHSVGENLEFIMTRDLAVMLEKMKQNTLWGGAAVLHGNEAVARQIDSATLARVAHNEQAMFIAYLQGQDFHMLEASNARLIGGSNITVGGGCAGTSSRAQNADPTKPFDPLKQNQEGSDQASDSSWENDPSSRKWKKGVCEVKSCSTRPGQTEVGPCSVCKSCQAKFDKGEDPTKEPARAQPRPQKAAPKVLSLFETKNNEIALAA